MKLKISGSTKACIAKHTAEMSQEFHPRSTK